MAKRRRFTAKFKARVALEALREERTVRRIAARHAVHPTKVSQWKRKAREGLEEVFERRAPGGVRRRPGRRRCTPGSGNWLSSGISQESARSLSRR